MKWLKNILKIWIQKNYIKLNFEDTFDLNMKIYNRDRIYKKIKSFKFI